MMFLLFRFLAATPREFSHHSSWGRGYPAARTFSAQEHQDPGRVGRLLPGSRATALLQSHLQSALIPACLRISLTHYYV